MKYQSLNFIHTKNIQFTFQMTQCCHLFNKFEKSMQIQVTDTQRFKNSTEYSQICFTSSTEQ